MPTKRPRFLARCRQWRRSSILFLPDLACWSRLARKQTPRTRFMRCVSPSVGNYRASDRKCSENRHPGPAPATSPLPPPPKDGCDRAMLWSESNPSPDCARPTGRRRWRTSGGRTRAQIIAKKCTLFGALDNKARRKLAEHAHRRHLAAMRFARSTSTAIVPGGESASSCATGFGGGNIRKTNIAMRD